MGAGGPDGAAATEECFMRFKQDPSMLSWIGGTVLSKLDGARDMFVQRQKYLRGRGDALTESFNAQV